MSAMTPDLIALRTLHFDHGAICQCSQCQWEQQRVWSALPALLDAAERLARVREWAERQPQICICTAIEPEAQPEPCGKCVAAKKVLAILDAKETT
jgi:hypothetical protein